MSMFSLAAPSFDPDGHLIAEAGTNTSWGEVTRRVNRAATLDEVGVSMNDRGHYASDRTIALRWEAGSRVESLVSRMVRLYPRVIMSCHLGCFEAAPARLLRDEVDLELELLVVRQLDEVTGL